MKLATYIHNGEQCVGMIDDLAGTVRRIALPTMLDVIGQYDRMDTLPPMASEAILVREVELLAPIPSPRRNIFCVGKNYREHAREFSKSGFEAGATPDAPVDDYPAVFTKPASTVIGTGASVPLHPDATAAVDYEGELAVVIGAGGINISRADAWRHVWGYTIVNDVTARDRQKNHRQWFLGKALDGFCPMGPGSQQQMTSSHPGSVFAPGSMVSYARMRASTTSSSTFPRSSSRFRQAWHSCPATSLRRERQAVWA